MTDAPLILLVEDEPNVADVVATYLETRRYRVAVAEDFRAAESRLRAMRPNLLITDVLMLGGTGFDLADLAGKNDVPVLLMSGHPETIRQCRDRGLPFLAKPFNFAELARRVGAMLQQVA